MKKLFSDAKERIKGFFRKSDNGDKKLTYKNKKEINKFLEDYYQKYTGLYLKSKDFLSQIK